MIPYLGLKLAAANLKRSNSPLTNKMGILSRHLQKNTLEDLKLGLTVGLTEGKIKETISFIAPESAQFVQPRRALRHV